MMLTLKRERGFSLPIWVELSFWKIFFQVRGAGLYAEIANVPSKLGVSWIWSSTEFILSISLIKTVSLGVFVSEDFLWAPAWRVRFREKLSAPRAVRLALCYSVTDGGTKTALKFPCVWVCLMWNRTTSAAKNTGIVKNWTITKLAPLLVTEERSVELDNVTPCRITITRMYAKLLKWKIGTEYSIMHLAWASFPVRVNGDYYYVAKKYYARGITKDISETQWVSLLEGAVINASKTSVTRTELKNVYTEALGLMPLIVVSKK